MDQKHLASHEDYARINSMPKGVTVKDSERKAIAKRLAGYKTSQTKKVYKDGRPSAYVYGSAKHMGPWERAGRYIGGTLGNAYAGPGAAIVGEKLGSYLHYIGKIFGSGDYATSAFQPKNNSLLSRTKIAPEQVPQFVSGKNTVRIRHREYLGDIYSSSTIGAFQIQQFPIQPGLASSFPWLSQVVGATYQQYRINGMVFEFRSMSADALNSTNTALGSIVMATDYDSKDAPFTNKAQMENTEFGVSCKPSSCMIHGIECARNQTSVSELYIRYQGVPAGADVRLYDMGNFYIATQGMQAANVNLGELWMSYDITFFKAIELAPNILSSYANYTLTATAANPMGANAAARVITPGGNDVIGLTFTGNNLEFPANTPLGSCFLVQYASNVTSSAVSIPAPVLSNGFEPLGIYSAPGAGQTTTSLLINVMVRLVTAPVGNAHPTINFPAFTSGALANTFLNVLQITGTTNQAP